MTIYQHQGQDVYTTAITRVTKRDLEMAETKPAVIEALTFFRRRGFRGTQTLEAYSDSGVMRGTDGFMVKIRDDIGIADVALMGLDITAFLAEARATPESVRDVTMNKLVTSYWGGNSSLLGFSLKP